MEPHTHTIVDVADMADEDSEEPKHEHEGPQALNQKRAPIESMAAKVLFDAHIKRAIADVKKRFVVDDDVDMRDFGFNPTDESPLTPAPVKAEKEKQ